MRVLALDTTTRGGSVAMVDDARVVGERGGDTSRTHAERLPGELLALLDAHGVSLADVDLFAVASGPGSFTGLRIGIATMLGLAFVCGRPIVGISALEALAHLASEGWPTGGHVGAWMDAHRRDVFAALYRVEPGSPLDVDRLLEVAGPTVGDPASISARWRAMIHDEPVRAVGDGAVLFADLIAREAPAWQIVAPRPLAAVIGRLALARAQRGGAAHPAGVQPLYIRRPDAELDRARKTAQHNGHEGH